VVEVNSRYHPEGQRFLVKGYPKDKEYRRLKLSYHIVDALVAFASARTIGLDDLLFTFPRQSAKAKASCSARPYQPQR
jgi:hypothetical protein